MALETTINSIADLNPNWPAATDLVKNGDDHIRNVKQAIKKTFPNLNGPVQASNAELEAFRNNIIISNSAITVKKPLDAGGLRITNVARGSQPNDVANYSQLQEAVTGSSGSATQSADSAALARKWAINPVDVIVADGQYSSYHWAQKAIGSATSAQNYATSASTAATIANSKANIATTKADEAASSATNAAASANTATSQVALATTQATKATQEADRAKSEADRATAIVDGTAFVQKRVSPVAIGQQIAPSGQDSKAIAIGYGAGQTNQGMNSIAIGNSTGSYIQKNEAIAIGSSAGNYNQGGSAIAIGQDSGSTDQESLAIAIGFQAGESGQKDQSIAIGASAGQTNQGSHAIAIGGSAGSTNQHSDSIVISAGGLLEETTGTGHIIISAGANSMELRPDGKFYINGVKVF